MDSRFDDIDSKLEDINMDALMGGINDAIKKTLDESLDFERVTVMVYCLFDFMSVLLLHNISRTIT